MGALQGRCPKITEQVGIFEDRVESEWRRGERRLTQRTSLAFHQQSQILISLHEDSEERSSGELKSHGP